MTRSRPRPLTREERALWAEVARSIAPLKGRPPVLADPAGSEPAATEQAAAPERPAPAAKSHPPRPRSSPAQPPLAPLERKLRQRLRRGRHAVDAAIDLHGLTQAQAHFTLLAFLRRSQAEGAGLVLVVTGKGARSGADSMPERGVLNRMVPHWLRLPEMRPLVLGFDEAGPRQGGAGALYVRLRRPGPAR